MILRTVSLSYFSKGSVESLTIRGQNFTVECLTGADDANHVIHGDRETILILSL